MKMCVCVGARFLNNRDWKGVKRYSFPCDLTQHHAMKAYWESGVNSSTHSSTSALDGGEWSASRPGLFTPRQITRGIHWIGGWVGTRVT
jgi:hypothetical protein